MMMRRTCNMRGEYNYLNLSLCRGTDMFNDVHGNATKDNADSV
jgi:hypothetical protein